MDFAIVGWNASQTQTVFLIVHYINLVSDMGYYRREAERTMEKLERKRIEDLESKRTSGWVSSKNYEPHPAFSRVPLRQGCHLRPRSLRLSFVSLGRFGEANSTH